MGHRMKKSDSRWRPAWLSALAMLGAVLTACGGGSQPAQTDNGPVTITFAQFESSGDDLKAQYAAMMDDFHKKNPNITVQLQAIDIDSYMHQVITECSAGNCPDVSIAIGPWIATFASAKLIADLQPYGGSVVSTMAAGPLKAAQYNGKQYGMPWAAADIVLTYNKTLMQSVGLDPNKPPTSIQELDQDIATAQAKKPDVVGLGIDTSKRDISLDFQSPFLNAFGAMPLARGKVTADTANMRAYLDWIRMIMSKHYSLPGKNLGGFRALSSQGNVLFEEDGPWFKAVVQSQNHMTDAQYFATYGVAAIPGSPAPGVSDGVTRKPSSVGGDHQLVMMQSSKHKQAAWKLIQYLTTDPFAIQQYDVSGGQGLPPNGKAVTGMDPTSTQQYLELYKSAITLPYSPQYSPTALAFATNVQKAYATSEPPDQIAREMQQDMTAALSAS